MNNKPMPWLFVLLTLMSATVTAEESFLPNMQRAPKEVITDHAVPEDQVPLPAWPRDANLLELTLDGAASPFRYFIDRQQLLIDKNGIVRYVIVIESRSGGRNVAYEGIRCSAKGQAKTFAYGASNQFVVLTDAQWEPLATAASLYYQQELWRFHFCNALEFRPRPKTDILYSLTAQRAH